MSRRITSKAVEKSNSNEAIQPGQRKQTAASHGSTTKEVKKKGRGTASSRVDHREATLVIYEYPPQITANEEVAGGETATQPNESDHRLVDFLRELLKRLDKLLYECFLQEFAKEFGKEVAKALAAALKWLIIVIALFLLLHR